MRSSVGFANSLILVAALSAGAADAEPLTLEELMRGLASSTGVVTEFRESKEIALLVQPLHSRGVMYFAPPDRLARFTLEPGRSSLVIDGDQLHFRDGTGEEFDLSANPMARVFVDNFIVLFNGDLPRLQELYDAALTTDGQRWSLVLTPRRAPLSAVIANIELTGDAEGIRKMVIRNTDGDRTTTTLETRARDRAFTASEIETLFAGRQPLPEAVGAK